MSIPKIGNQMGCFGQIRKNSLFRFCRPILDIFGLTLLNCETETSILFFHPCDYDTFRLKVVQVLFIKANKQIRTSRLSRICEVHINEENFTRPRGYDGHSSSVTGVAD